MKITYLFTESDLTFLMDWENKKFHREELNSLVIQSGTLLILYVILYNRLFQDYGVQLFTDVRFYLSLLLFPINWIFNRIKRQLLSVKMKRYLERKYHDPIFYQFNDEEIYENESFYDHVHGIEKVEETSHRIVIYFKHRRPFIFELQQQEQNDLEWWLKEKHLTIIKTDTHIL